MGRPPSNGLPSFRFNSAEVNQMEAILQKYEGHVPPRDLLVALANNFSNSPERAGKVMVQMKQVWNWFQNRRYALRSKLGKSPGVPSTSPVGRDEVDAVRNIAPAPQQMHVPSAPNVARNLSESPPMEFEAKSSRDGAWYDVQQFLSHRYLDTGNPEVLVRFAGFGPEEDEWINIRMHVRQRSLPCEASECIVVLPGDLILCFQEGKEQALYFDAHVLDAQRRRHDVRGCRCRFLVRYDHDQSEEIVPLRKICRRPETDYRLQQLHATNEAASASVQHPSASVPVEPLRPVIDLTSSSISQMTNPNPGTAAIAVASLTAVNAGPSVPPPSAIQTPTPNLLSTSVQAATATPSPAPTLVQPDTIPTSTLIQTSTSTPASTLAEASPSTLVSTLTVASNPVPAPPQAPTTAPAPTLTPTSVPVPALSPSPVLVPVSAAAATVPVATTSATVSVPIPAAATTVPVATTSATVSVPIPAAVSTVPITAASASVSVPIPVPESVPVPAAPTAIPVSVKVESDNPSADPVLIESANPSAVPVKHEVVESANLETPVTQSPAHPNVASPDEANILPVAKVKVSDPETPIPPGSSNVLGPVPAQAEAAKSAPVDSPLDGRGNAGADGDAVNISTAEGSSTAPVNISTAEGSSTAPGSSNVLGPVPAQAEAAESAPIDSPLDGRGNAGADGGAVNISTAEGSSTAPVPVPVPAKDVKQ